MGAAEPSFSIVGRAAELRRIEDALRLASSGQGFAALLAGEPGIGKSCLLREAALLAEGMGYTVLRGSAMEGAGRPFEALRGAFSGSVVAKSIDAMGFSSFSLVMLIGEGGDVVESRGVDAADALNIASVLEAVNSFVRDSLGSGGGGSSTIGYGAQSMMTLRCGSRRLVGVITGAMAPEAAKALEDCVSRMGDGTNDKEALDSLAKARFPRMIDLETLKPGEEVAKVSHQVLAELQAMSSRAPCLLVVEDLQWADAGTLSAFEYAARGASGWRLVILGSCRTGAGSAWERLERAAASGAFDMMALSGLEEKAIADIIDARWPGNDFARELSGRMRERSEGNPFFVTEMLAQLDATGRVVRDEIGFHLDASSAEIPSSVNELVEMRLSTLDASALEAAEWCSCAGMEFSLSVVASASGLSDMQQAVSDLVVAGIVSDGCKSFTHALYRSAVHGGIPERRLVHIHRSLGEAIERSLAEGDDVPVFELATHFHKGGCASQALKYCSMAGEKADGAFSFDRSIHYYGMAIGLTEAGSPLHAKTLERLSDAMVVVGQVVDAIKNYRTLIDSLTEPLAKASLMKKMAGAHWKAGDYAAAIEDIDEGERYVGDGVADYWNLENLRAACLIRKGMFADAKAISLRIVEALGKQGDRIQVRDLGRAHNLLGLCDFYLGDYDSAVRNYTIAGELRERNGDLAGASITYNNIGLVHRRRGDSSAALACQEKSLAFEERLGSPWGMATSYINIGLLQFERGDIYKAGQLFNKSLRLRTNLGDSRGVAVAMANLASYYLEMGELARAEGMARESLRTFESMGDTSAGIEIGLTLGHILTKAGRPRDSISIVSNTLDMAKKAGYEQTVAEASLELGRALLQVGDAAGAERLAGEAALIAEKTGSKTLDAWVALARGDIQLHSGNARGAAVEYGRSASAFLRIGFALDEARARYLKGRALELAGDAEAGRVEMGAAIGFFRSKGLPQPSAPDVPDGR